ncbi:MAG TPA: hypothetical protein VGC05_12315 [Mycobacterium sp.]
MSGLWSGAHSSLPELVVLDMAGTTIDDGQQVYRVLGETARAHGAPASEAEIARWHGVARQFGANDDAASAPDVGSCDVLLEFSGSSTALQAGLVALDGQGVAVLAGSVAPTAPSHSTPSKSCAGSCRFSACTTMNRGTSVRALDFLGDTRDRFPWADLVAEPKPLADVASLLADAPGPSPRYSVAP